MASAVIVNAVASTNWNSSNNPTINLPALSAGDLLLMQICADSTTATFTAPTGWTIHVQTNGTNFISAGILWKIADGSEGASVNVPISQFRDGTANVYCIDAGTFDATTPIDAHSVSTGLGTSISVVGMTTTVDVSRFCFGHYNVKGTAITKTGFTKHGDVSGIASTDTQSVGYQEDTDDTSPGATNGQAMGNGAFTGYVNYQVGIALNTGGGGGTNIDAPSFLTDDVFPSATVTATGEISPAVLETDDVFPSATVAAAAAVTPTVLLTDDVFPAVSLAATAGITPTVLLTDDVFPSAVVTGQANVTFPVLVTDDEFPSVTITTGVTVTPAVLVTVDSFPAVSIATESDAPVLLTDDVFPSVSVSATAGITPSVLVTDDAFPPVVITSSAGISAPNLATDDVFPSVTIVANAAVTPSVLLTDDEFPSPSVSTPGVIVPAVLVTTDLFPSPTFSSTSTAVPTVLVTDDLFPSSSVDDGSGTGSVGNRGGVVWIDEPWTNWPVEEERLSV